MTLPTNIILPSTENGFDSPEQNERYQKELTYVLQRMYADMADTINGLWQSSEDAPNRRWTPTLVDTVDDSITFTYDVYGPDLLPHRIGRVIRQGLMTEVFFDIKWTAASAALTGNMYIELPYKVALSPEKPFVGVVQPSIFAYTAGTECVINAIQDTFRLEVWNVGSGVTTANQASVAAGHLIGHIRYVGQALERN